MNLHIDVQDSTKAGTALPTCHVPWQLLDTQASGTIRIFNSVIQ